MNTVLLIGNDDQGLYKFRRELIAELLNNGYSVDISTPYGPYIPMLQDCGCNFIPLEFNRRGKNPLGELRLLIKYGKLIKKKKYCVVLLYTIKPTLYGGLICRIRRIPYIANVTGLSPALAGSELLKRLCFIVYRSALKRVNVLYFQNKQNLEVFKENRVTAQKVKLIPGSGVNLQEHKYEEYTEGEEIKILYVGRITKVKGMDEWLRAISILNEKKKNLVFEFIGECFEPYKEEIERLHSEKKIIYYGKSKNPHEYMKNAQAVIMPSYGEGMSNVLLEASACGRPILASAVPGCKEILVDGVTGIEFQPHSVESILEAVDRFLCLTREQRRQMGLNGREHVEKYFSRDIVVEEYMKEIKKICEVDKDELV